MNKERFAPIHYDLDELRRQLEQQVRQSLARDRAATTSPRSLRMLDALERTLPVHVDFCVEITSMRNDGIAPDELAKVAAAALGNMASFVTDNLPEEFLPAFAASFQTTIDHQGETAAPMTFHPTQGGNA